MMHDATDRRRCARDLVLHHARLGYLRRVLSHMHGAATDDRSSASEGTKFRHGHPYRHREILFLRYRDHEAVIWSTVCLDTSQRKETQNVPLIARSLTVFAGLGCKRCAHFLG